MRGRLTLSAPLGVGYLAMLSLFSATAGAPSRRRGPGRRALIVGLLVAVGLPGVSAVAVAESGGQPSRVAFTTRFEIVGSELRRLDFAFVVPPLSIAVGQGLGREQLLRPDLQAGRASPRHARADFPRPAHTGASLMIAVGCHVKVIAERMGHADGGVLVLKRYGHLYKGARRQAANALESHVFSAAEKSGCWMDVG